MLRLIIIKVDGRYVVFNYFERKKYISAGLGYFKRGGTFEPRIFYKTLKNP